MPGAGDFTDPVSYSGWWVVVAVVLPVLVVAWYAGVTWWTRDRTVDHRPARLRRWLVRRAHLRELDRIEAAADAGSLSLRQAHQEVSATVRSFVTEAGDVDARTMNLRQLREAGVEQVVPVVEAVYPPAFGPDDDGSREGLAQTLTEARRVVGGR